uniref:Ig-like domain-containing protein n=1 Tax=Globodera pallida TaxID=36090 RepID=A0A183CPC6_GLOPA
MKRIWRKKPNPEPTWFHNGQAIRPSNAKGFTFENHGKTLVFNVTAEHIGRYDCKFEKHPSSYDRSFDIKVNAAPYWHDQPPPNVNTSEGETVTFDCKSSGNPTPTVTFYKNGVEMRKPRPGENWVIDGSKLTIFDVKQGVGGVGDNAVYQCKVENKHGYLWTNFYLNLLAFQPKLMEEEPGQVEAIQGRPFSLSCNSSLPPLAKVQSTKMKGPSRFTIKSRDDITVEWSLYECPAGTNLCAKVTCAMDTEALRELAYAGEHIYPGSRKTTIIKDCMPPGEEECEIPNKLIGQNMRKQKNYCRISCCTGHECNGTLGLRSFGTVAAMIAFVAAFFVRWN